MSSAEIFTQGVKIYNQVNYYCALQRTYSYDVVISAKQNGRGHLINRIVSGYPDLKICKDHCYGWRHHMPRGTRRDTGKCLPFFAFRAPGPAREGAVPRGTGSHYAHLGAAALGPQEVRPHAQGSRLDVHTELPIVCVRGSVSTYIQNCQLFVTAKSSRRTYRVAKCLCTWEPFWGPI